MLNKRRWVALAGGRPGRLFNSPSKGGLESVPLKNSQQPRPTRTARTAVCKSRNLRQNGLNGCSDTRP